jgi:hypothetical protein
MTNTNDPLFINQNDQSNGLWFDSKKDHPNHTRHVKINFSKMTKGIFGPYINLFFYQSF